MSALEDHALPAPTPQFAVIAAALIEHEKDCPGFTERVRARLESEANLSGAVRLRGPRMEPAVREAVAQGLAWVAMLTPVVELEAPPPVRRRRWGFL